VTELTPDAKRLLAQLRDVDDPTHKERARGDAAVRGMLETHGLLGLPPLAAEPPASKPFGSKRARESAGRPVQATRAADVPVSPTLAAPSGAGAKLAWSMGAALIVMFGLYAAQVLRTPANAPVLSGPVAAASPSAPALPEPTASEALPQSRNELPVAAALGGAPHPRRGTTKPAPSSLSEELKFLASVDAELRSGGYDHVLQRLAHHKGSPALAEERTALRVLALCGRDNDAAALRARDQFLQGAPSSVLAARVRGACPAGSRP
jgi:hypothetical protein